MAQRSCNTDATEITSNFSDKPQPLVEPPSPVPASDMASIDKLRSSGAGDSVMAMAMTPSTSSSSSSSSSTSDLRPIPSPLVLSPSTPQPASSSSRQSPVQQARQRHHHSVKADPPELPSPLSLTPSIPQPVTAVPNRPTIPHTVTGISQSCRSISTGQSIIGLNQSPIGALHDPASSSAPAKPPTNRCFSCRKRVGLLGFKCRCGDVFCATHRYSDRHNCTYDYKAAGRAAIAKENPVVLASKIVKI